jgi:uncharacterized membrane protein
LSTARLAAFAVIALAFGAAYALITPAFEVPDEVGHYWRATAAAYGHVVVGKRVPLPRGYRVIVWAMGLTPDDNHVDADRLRRARGVMLQDDYRDPTPIGGLYSPATYAPQIAAAAVSRALRVRPFYQFFAGRLATLVFCVIAVALICRAAPEYAALIETAALLPMALFLFGSWSADALTIVAAFLTSALLLRRVIPSRGDGEESPGTLQGIPRFARNDIAIVLAVAWLSFCKPPYVFMALLVVAAPVPRRFVALVMAVMAAGTIASSAMTMTAMTTPGERTRPIDTRAQLRFIAAEPLHFAYVIAHDFRLNARDYVESMTGRLGRYELKLPQWCTLLLLAMLAAVGMTCGPPLPPRARLLIWAIVAAIWLATVTYLYLTSSIAGGDVIEGTQGRYLVPLLPLMMATLRIRRLRVPMPAMAVYAIAIVANVVGLLVLFRHYYA